MNHTWLHSGPVPQYMLPDWLVTFNTVAWVVSNFLILYIGFALIVFLIGYYYWFDPRATTGGRLIYRFALSLLGVILLIAISLWVNPSEGRAWFQYPGDVLWWRPALRLVAYTGVAYTITSLAILLGIRRFHPEKLKTAPPVEPLVKVRGRN